MSPSDVSIPVAVISPDKEATRQHHDVGRLYKERFFGLCVFFVFGIVTTMSYCWFGPIAIETSTEFGISVTQVNWLGNIVSCIYIPVSLLIPVLTSRFGIARCVQLGALFILISGWVRYAGTIASLSPSSAYALLIFGQIFSALAIPIFQVLGPMYSERWFDLDGRITATMVIAIADPVGCSLGQILSPLLGTARHSILVLAIITTSTTPIVLLISEAPPTPPTYAGIKQQRTISSLCRAVLGRSVPQTAYMSPRERVDFVIVTILFGVFIAATNTLTVLSGEWFYPAGYSSSTAGLLGATLLLSGMAASFITSPLFDRLFTHKLGIALKTLVPIIACCWFSLIWAVRPNNSAALFIIMAIIGISSVTLLPVGLDLAVELTRNAEASSAILWCFGNLCSIILILAEGALRSPNPPYSMRNAFILQGTVVMVFGVLVFFLRAKQVRREMDESMAAERAAPPSKPDAVVEVKEVTMDKEGGSTPTDNDMVLNREGAK